jgi:hypothetical protein
VGEIRFLGRARGGRCVYCHDSLAGSVQTCPECSATWHEDCGQGARRCPTTGCSGPAPGASSRRGRKRNWHQVLTPAVTEDEPARTDRPRPGFRARFGPYVRLLLSTLWNTTAACAATAYLLWPLLNWTSFWKFCSTGKNGSHNPALLAALLGLFWTAVAVWGLLVTVRWLWKVPSVVREVASLLDDTHPRPCG